MVVSIFSEATVSTSLTLGEVPAARTGPSLTLVGDSVYMFGGRLMDSHVASNDLFVFDLATLVWERVVCKGAPPAPRFLHSATAWGDSHIVVCGGGASAGLDIEPINDICIYDILSGRWAVYEFSIDEFAPRYAHMACLAGNQLHILGGQSGDRRYVMDRVMFDMDLRELSKLGELEYQLGSHYCASSGEDILYSSKKSTERQLLTVSSEIKGQSFPGERLPPSFRFPDVHRLGSSLVVSGCFTSNNLQAYGVWVLDTDTLDWRSIDTGSCLARGSWNRGVLHSATNRYVVFGHRERDLRSDYQFRRINFTHVSAISLEAFAIYRNPTTCTDTELVELGLVLMYEPRFSNFSLLTDDGYRIHANLGVLRQRWPAIDDFIRCQDEVGVIQLQESYHVAMVFVRFLYTNSLDFEEAQTIDVLGSLLVFARSYSCTPLSDLAAFHLHSLLTINSAPLIYRYASSACRDGLRLRCLSLMISQRTRLANDRLFWKQYPKALRTEIISFMPPNFKSPYYCADADPESPKPDAYNYTHHFLPTPDRSTLDPITPPTRSPTEPIFGESKPRKSRTASSFLKFNTKRPSLASFFSFSGSSSSSSNSSTQPILMDPEIDPKLSRALNSYGIGIH